MKRIAFTIATLAAAIGSQAAALPPHDLAAELRTVREHMQAGEYRYALAYAAHIVGEHRESLEGARTYAWLLEIGGQEAAARRVLKEDAGARDRPPIPALSREAQPLPSSARVKGSGVLLGAQRVLVPLAPLECEHVIVRNALGDVSRGHIERRLPEHGVAIAALDEPMPFDGHSVSAAAAPHAGSAGFAVGYSLFNTDEPSWPTLAAGFIGRPIDAGTSRSLDARFAIGGRAGVVFDRWGRLLGLAMPDGNGARLVRVSQVADATADVPLSTPQAKPVEQIYEAALRTVVQVIIGED